MIPFLIFLTIVEFLSFILGWIAGYVTRKQDVQNFDIFVGDKIKQMIRPSIPVGILRRPSVQKLNSKSEPQEIREAKEAMKETLDHIPELQP